MTAIWIAASAITAAASVMLDNVLLWVSATIFSISTVICALDQTERR